MPRKKDPNSIPKKMGRPVIEINWVEFDKLCLIQCTLTELAAYFDCSEDKIENAVKEQKGRTFSEYYNAKRGFGKVSLRRRQFQAAMAGDKTMLVWLGKQYLGQGETWETRDDVTINQTNVTMVEDNRTTAELIKLIMDRRSENVSQQSTTRLLRGKQTESSSGVCVTDAKVVVPESPPAFVGTQSNRKPD